VNRWKNPAVLLLLVGVSLIAAGCRHTPAEQHIREAIAAVVQAAQASDARATVAPLADDFEGNAGALDRSALRNMVRALALQQTSIGVHIGPITTAARGSRIVASFTVTLTTGRSALPDRVGIYQVETAWRQDSGTWRCYTATWKQVM
jgi:hypothetical protein